MFQCEELKTCLPSSFMLTVYAVYLFYYKSGAALTAKITAWWRILTPLTPPTCYRSFPRLLEHVDFTFIVQVQRK